MTDFLPEQRRALDYLARKGTQAPIDALRNQVRDAFAGIEQIFDAVAEHDRERNPAPGKWSAHQILDHLVVSHEPAIAQLETLLAGEDVEDPAVPAGLHSAALEEWDTLRARLGETHRRFLRLLDAATDAHSLEPKAPVEMVVKVDGVAKPWIERLDWKALAQAIRAHTLQHQEQLNSVHLRAG
jgi:hypothetical protein